MAAERRDATVKRGSESTPSEPPTSTQPKPAQDGGLSELIGENGDFLMFDPVMLDLPPKQDTDGKSSGLDEKTQTYVMADDPIPEWVPKQD